MKKKLSLLLLVMFIIPVFAIFGCDEVSYFSVAVKSSSSTLGTVVDINGTYEEGTTITLKATRKTGEQQNGYFICWLHENSTVVTHGETYEITPTKDENDVVVSSTLKFDLNQNTQGTYTAVFGGLDGSINNMMYAKLESFRLAKQSSFILNTNGLTEDSDSIEVLPSVTFSVQHGPTSSNLQQAHSETDRALKDNLIYNAENVSNVVYLATNQHLLFKVGSLNLRAELKYRSSTPSTIVNNYEYIIDYGDDVYTVMFGFNTTLSDTAEDYVAVLTFRHLS